MFQGAADGRVSLIGDVHKVLIRSFGEFPCTSRYFHGFGLSVCLWWTVGVGNDSGLVTTLAVKFGESANVMIAWDGFTVQTERFL